MSKSIKLVQANEEATNFFIGMADENTRNVTPLVFLKKSQFITQETFLEVLSKVKIVIEDGYLPETI